MVSNKDLTVNIDKNILIFVSILYFNLGVNNEIRLWFLDNRNRA